MKRVGYNLRPSSFDWLDGTNVGDTYHNFADGEPDNNQGDENCGVFFTSDDLWRGEKCTSRPFVCQREAGHTIIKLILSHNYKTYFYFCFRHENFRFL